MHIDPTILVLVFLAGFYFILEGLALLLRFIFNREAFMSWWDNKPVECDSYTMYCPTYNRSGNIEKMTLNMKWIHRKMKEGTLGTRDK